MSTHILNGWKEIAAYLKVHRQTARQWATQEGLPIAKIQGAILTTTDAVDSWVEKRVTDISTV